MRNLLTKFIADRLLISLGACALIVLASSALVHGDRNTPATHEKTLLTGDSQALHFPGEYPRICFPGHRAEDVIPLINAYKGDTTSIDRIVVMTGTNNIALGDSPEQTMKACSDVALAAAKKFPHAKDLVIIPTFLQLQIASENNTGDGWHLNREGYKKIQQLEPDFFNAPFSPMPTSE